MATVTEESPQASSLPALQERIEPDGVPTAETAECCCPDFCERDHDNE